VVVEEDISCEIPVVARENRTREALGAGGGQPLGRPAESADAGGRDRDQRQDHHGVLVRGADRRRSHWYRGVSVPGARRKPAPFTTPGPLELHAELGGDGSGGVHGTCPWSAGSHALQLGAARGRAVRGGRRSPTSRRTIWIFTAPWEAYRDAKALLFTRPLEGAPRSSTSTPNMGPWMAETGGRAAGKRCNRRGARRFRVVEARPTPWPGFDARLATPIGEVVLRSPLIGAFNLENLAVGRGDRRGAGAFPRPRLAPRLSSVEGGLPGRLERVGRAVRGVRRLCAHAPMRWRRVDGGGAAASPRAA